MKVSVVIPVYNEEDFLKDCLESVVNQEVPADEIIVVDNNSTDASVAIAKKFPQVTVIHEKKQGITPARAAGFEAAKYDILARCDADSRVPKNWIKKIKHNFETKDIVGLSGPVYIYDLPKKKYNSALHKFLIFDCVEFFLGHPAMIGPNMAISKKGWNQVKDELCKDDKDAHEDFDIAMHITKYGTIIFDKTLIVNISSRTFTVRYSTILEYPARFVKSLYSHHMLFNFTKNPSVKTFLLLLLCLATIHFTVYLIYIIQTHNFRIFNVFNIIGIPLLFPGFAEQPWTDVFSVVFYLAFTGIVYMKLKSNKTK